MQELKLDEILQSVLHKAALLSFVSKLIDVYAESDFDVVTTNLRFHKIDFFWRDALGP